MPVTWGCAASRKNHIRDAWSPEWSSIAAYAWRRASYVSADSPPTSAPRVFNLSRASL
ncbi:hypothetical protein [Allobranchiibius huperziae]|uniref:hypothetical protein n=1 Tax=Allobranchiibius huperziae TaxID=1874116 RepID=UPI001C5402F8|nr:hypothetical protein [Allobranchiibius huperziae]